MLAQKRRGSLADRLFCAGPDVVLIEDEHEELALRGALIRRDLGRDCPLRGFDKGFGRASHPLEQHDRALERHPR